MKLNAWEAKKFEDYLVKKKRLSTRVVNNYVNRCRRVEGELKVSLIDATSSN